MKLTTTVSALALAAAIVPQSLHAADGRQLPGVIDRTLPNFTIPEAPKEETQPLQEPPVMEQVPGQNEVVTTLKGINFAGNTVISTEELQLATAGYINRQLTRKDLAQLKYDVTKMFYDRGYILVKATTPPQDLSDGTLDVQIYEARIGENIVHDNNALNPVVTKAFAARVTKGKVFHESDAESMITDVDDLPNVDASVTLKPGNEFGTTDLHITTDNADEDVNYVQLDNYGSKYTGRNVFTGYLEKSNLLNFGETFNFTGRISDGGLWSAKVGADTPIALHNIHLETSYLHSENDIRDRYTGGIEQEGESDIVTAGLRSDLLNTRENKITLRSGFEVRDHDYFVNNQTQSSDNITQFYVEPSYLHRQSTSVWYGAVKVSKGIAWLDASEEGDLRLSRPGNPQAYRAEPVLLANYRVQDSGTLKFVGTGQVASDTLLSSDLFILGGYGSVRGFQPAQEIGEAGWQFSIEYLHDIPANEDWSLGAGPFLDGGAVYNRLPASVSGVQNTHLYSAGLGFQATTEFLKNADTTFRVDWAHTLGDYDGDVASDALYLKAYQEF